MKYALILTFLLMSTYLTASACRDEHSLEEYSKLSKYVFIAQVSKAEQTKDPEITRFYLKNIENIKGNAVTNYYQEEYKIKHSSDASLKSGDKWLIFLDTEVAKINLGGCGPSAPLSYLKWAEKDWKSRIKNSNQKSVVGAKDAQQN